MQRIKIKYLLKKTSPHMDQKIKVCGWIRSIRVQKAFFFITLNDGSSYNTLQVIGDDTLTDFDKLTQSLATGASICVQGTLIASPGKNQETELKASHIDILGIADPSEYPLQKKRHSFEYLRTIAHLRPRTNTQRAVTRVRNCLAIATHQFFQKNDFLYIHTPILTAANCEGAGDMFHVTTFEDPPKDPKGHVDYSQDFFKKPAFLTVSGQLNGEIYACALGDIYTFGPTFRAENSHTSRHLAEFWMIEPEMAFCDLAQCMDVAENYTKYLMQAALTECPEEMTFFDQFIEKGLIKKLEDMTASPFVRLPYTEAITLLENAKNTSFEYPVSWGVDLQAEHERYLTEVHFKKPVIIYNYPKDIKAFYMKQNDDQKTVAAMDLLVPKIGELIGGSQREDRLELLEQKLDEHSLPKEEYWWYLELRKFGSVPHSGFGLGFERAVQFITGMENVRDVIPFPRTPGHIDF
jgi:asparaginyl-tRNA synthetase